MIEYFGQIFVLFGINVILASSLNVINGYCGLFSLGHAGFFAVGAYSSAAFTTLIAPEWTAQSPHLALLVSSLIAMGTAGIAGLAVGIPCLRLTGDYLAIATVGFGEIIRIVFLNMDVVGASRGMPGIPRLTTIPWVIVGAAFTLIILNNLIKSSFGRCIKSIREDEIAAQAMGVNVRFYKTFSFVVGSLFAGLAGSLFAHNQEFLHPSNFVFMISVSVLLMIVLGGLGSQKGAVLGAFIVTLLPELLRLNEFVSQIRMLVFGLIMILVMLVFPEGLLGLLKKGSLKNRFFKKAKNEPGFSGVPL
jgi:branched-chain amino acid transport system permease protein